ncbi:MAG TPA: BatA domain-containing protein [Opitutales bacterium]|nr:BatA domain-containing protein [Opitutales bacterium]
MHLIFANPAGWFALLGIPALVIIHLLQRQSRRVEISTMFLLEKQEVESRAGRRIERWRSSRLFWLQVAAMVLLSWLLSEPRWVEGGTLQRVAMVLDSSLAMEAFRSQTQKGIAADSATLARGAARTEWLLLESDNTRPPLYHGENRAEMLAALDQWRASLGPHDPAPALRAARVSVGDKGLVFFITYRPPPNGPLPVEAQPLAYAHALDNVGISAAGVELQNNQPVWHVLVCNQSNTMQKRAWWIESGPQKSAAQTLELQPGETLALQGAFPPNTERMTFALEPDGFTLDDRAPMVLPLPKQLAVAFRGPDDFIPYVKPIAQLIDNIAPAAEGTMPDLLFDLGDDPGFTPAAVARVHFSEENAATSTDDVHAHPAPEKHPLMDALNWSGLLYHPLKPLPRRKGDTTLMWDGVFPLITLNEEIGRGPTLIFNFDPRHSNASHLPAFVLLVNRFAEMARQGKAAYERNNFPAGLPISLVVPRDAREVKLEAPPPDAPAGAAPVAQDLPLASAGATRAPSPPEFFTVTVDGRPWVAGASQFPDPRESDFRDAREIPLRASAQVTREAAHSQPDLLAPVWLLALLGALLASWRETAPRLK